MNAFLRLLSSALLFLPFPAAAAVPEFALPAAAGVRIAYRGVTLIDGAGAPPDPNMAVVTSDDRIEQVVDEESLTEGLLAGAQQVDLSGRFLLPGLIDSHQHLATPPQPRQSTALLRRALYSGVTSMMAVGQGDSLGVVAPGRRADFVVIARDPAADIGNIRSVLPTVNGGRRFDRSDYRPTAPGESVHD